MLSCRFDSLSGVSGCARAASGKSLRYSPQRKSTLSWISSGGRSAGEIHIRSRPKTPELHAELRLVSASRKRMGEKLGKYLEFKVGSVGISKIQDGVRQGSMWLSMMH